MGIRPRIEPIGFLKIEKFTFVVCVHDHSGTGNKDHDENIVIEENYFEVFEISNGLYFENGREDDSEVD